MVMSKWRNVENNGVSLAAKSMKASAAAWRPLAVS